MQYGKIRFSHKSGVRKVQKKCCSVAKQKQHKQNKNYRDQFSIILEEVQEWFRFGFTKEQILHLAENVRKGRKEREKWNTKQCGGN